MPRGGVITVETRTELVEHADAEGRAYSVLSVADTGVGMDESVLARAFEPFFTTKPVGAGSGLGLSTVYGIVAQSGGDVAIDSAPNEGTTVTIRLPAAAAAPRDDGPAQPPDASAVAGSPTIVLVEDDALVRELISRLLTLDGYTVVVAPDAVEAEALVERRGLQIDLLVTDVVMPSMSGPELAERLRERQPELQVLFISGYNETAVAGYGALAEDVDLLRKPFPPNELSARVHAALARRSA
jgi:CheY-like chemotaxis protein